MFGSLLLSFHVTIKLHPISVWGHGNSEPSRAKAAGRLRKCRLDDKQETENNPPAFGVQTVQRRAEQKEVKTLYAQKKRCSHLAGKHAVLAAETVW